MNSRFSVMGTDGQWVPPPLVLLKQTCWLQEFQRECPFKCCKTASYKQLFGEDRNKDHRQPGQGVYKKLSRRNNCSECCGFLTLIKSNNFPQEIFVSALQKNLILTITEEIKKCSFPCAFYIKVFSCGCLRRTMSKLAFLCSCLSDNPSIFLCGFRLAPINISKQDLSLDWHVL